MDAGGTQLSLAVIFSFGLRCVFWFASPFDCLPGLPHVLLLPICIAGYDLQAHSAVCRRAWLTHIFSKNRVRYTAHRGKLLAANVSEPIRCGFPIASALPSIFERLFCFCRGRTYDACDDAGPKPYHSAPSKCKNRSHIFVFSSSGYYISVKHGCTFWDISFFGWCGDPRRTALLLLGTNYLELELGDKLLGIRVRGQTTWN